MSAQDSLGSCRRRGEVGHLPHPDGAPCLWRQEDGTTPVPGVYSPDQGSRPAQDYTAPAPREAWLDGYRYALLNPDDPGVQADLARYQAEQAEERERLVDQLQEQLAKAEAECKRLAKGWEQAYQQGWRQGQEQRLEWQRELRMVTEERNKLQVQARVCREDADRNAARAEKAEQALAHVNRERDRAHDRIAQLEAAVRTAERLREEASAGRMTQELAEARADRDRAREQAAECRLEAAHLHRQLSALGVDPERLASMVGSGQAVELFGRVYVARDLALADLLRDDDKQDGALLEPGACASTELLEAQGGVFVPVPKGHMLSVTVTPYDATPDDDVVHVCSMGCHDGGCPEAGR